MPRATYKSLVRNSAKKQPYRNPLRIDPTRTSLLRQRLTSEIGRRFAKLKGAIIKLVEDEDAFGLKEVNHKPPTANYDFASTHVLVTDPEVVAELYRIQSLIDPMDLVKLEDNPHVTVRYGLHPDEEDLHQRVQALMQGAGRLLGTVLGLSLFHTPKADVLKFGIHSQQLEALNRRLGLLPNTQTHREYSAHMTVAYLLPGTGHKYRGIPSTVTGKLLAWDSMELSDTEGETVTIVTNAFCPTGEGGGVDPSCSPGSKLSETQEDAIAHYGTQVGHQDVNTYLRTGIVRTKYKEKNPHDTTDPTEKSKREYLDQLISRIDSAMEPLAEDTQVVRVLRGEGLGRHSVGAIVEDKAYMSTSTAQDFASKWKYSVGDDEVTSGLELRLTIPKGTKTIDVSKTRGSYGEDELLLERGLSYRIDSIDGNIVRATVLRSPTVNVFCPTGPGGGVDPTCGGEAITKAALAAVDKAPTVKYDPKDPGAPRPDVAARGELMKSGFKVDSSQATQDLIRKVMDDPDSTRETEEVPLASITARQVSVSKESIRYLIGKGNRSEMPYEQPVIVRVGGKNYLYDGTHRATADKLLGKATIKATVYTAKAAPAKGKAKAKPPAKSKKGKGPTKNEDYTYNAAQWKPLTSPEKLTEFQRWLKRQLAALLLGRTEQQLWEAYAKEGLRKGAGRSFDDVMAKEKARAQLGDLVDSPSPSGRRKTSESREPVTKRMDFYDGSREQFLKSAFAQPVAVEKVKLLASRSYTDLKNVTESMSTKMGRTLTDSLVQGKSPREVARELAKEVDISRERAETIARTEIIRAHAEGQLLAMKQMGVAEVGVQVEWKTVGDEKVCELCQPMEGVVIPIDRATGMIPRHPNCRCAWIPAGVGEDTSSQKHGEAAEAALLESGLAD